MDPFSWTCPFCNKHTTITNSDVRHGASELTIQNKHGGRYLHIQWIVCPNPDCKEITLNTNLFKYIFNNRNANWHVGPPLDQWRLIPPSKAKVFPDYIPVAIRNDYLEACSISELSPKAAATLARRCLQGMIRDYWKISKKRLFDEIEAIKMKVEPSTWKAIDAVRKVGNIGAHMEKDINLIVDVDPKEAVLLINLIETLIKDWYINQYERNELMQAVVTISQEKAHIKDKSNDSNENINV